MDGWVWKVLVFAQGAAILEIVHAKLKLVPSPVMTTALQVSSRLFVLLLLIFFHEVTTDSVPGRMGTQFIIVAWGITEIIRYSHYAFQLIPKKADILLWLRYTLFYVLYPIGVVGELLIIFSVIDLALSSWLLKIFLFGLVFIIYLIFFPRMYRYMIRQRRKKLVG